MSVRFIVLFGPPAVGKMAVGREIERVIGFRLFHNHMAIEPVLPFFRFGSLPFGRLVDLFRTRVVEEVADSDLPGLIFTFVWNLDDPNDTNHIERLCRPFVQRGDDVAMVELQADLTQRLIRNRGADRLAEKASKRDLAASERNLLDLERYRLNTDGTIPLPYALVRVDSTHLSVRETADEIIASLRLERTRP